MQFEGELAEHNWCGESSGCSVLKRSHDIFQAYEAEQKPKPKKVLFLVVSTTFFRQNRAIYAVDGTTEIVNGQCPLR